MPKHLLHVFSTFGVGGPQVRACDLINHFGAKYRHTILAMDNDFSCRSKLSAEGCYEIVKIDVEKQQPLKNYRLFATMLRRLSPDLLLTYNWGAVEWGLINGLLRTCPHLHAEDGFGPEEAAGQKRRRIWARQVFLANARRIIVPSQTLRQIARQVWRFGEHKVCYVPNGIDIDLYARHYPWPAVSQLADCRGKLIIGTVATLRREKNLARLIRVFAHLPPSYDARLVIVGNGAEYAALKQQVAELRLEQRVRLLGHHNAPAEVLASFDIFAVSSDTEQMPLSVLEAMAAGLPVVGTAVGDIKAMVSPINQRFLSPVEDERAFQLHLEELLGNPAQRQELGRANQLRCREQFDKQRMFESYGRLYDLEF